MLYESHGSRPVGVSDQVVSGNKSRSPRRGPKAKSPKAARLPSQDPCHAERTWGLVFEARSKLSTFVTAGVTRKAFRNLLKLQARDQQPN